MAKEKKEVEVNAEGQEVTEAKATVTEGKFYVYDSKFNLVHYATTLEDAQATAQKFNGTFKEVK